MLTQNNQLFEQTLRLMLDGLSRMDQKVARSCAEFFSGIARIVPQENPNLQNLLPHLLPVLLHCCRFTDADQMNIVHTKDGDHIGKE
jgi:hypothetical protein